LRKILLGLKLWALITLKHYMSEVIILVNEQFATVYINLLSFAHAQRCH